METQIWYLKVNSVSVLNQNSGKNPTGSGCCAQDTTFTSNNSIKTGDKFVSTAKTVKCGPVAKFFRAALVALGMAVAATSCTSCDPINPPEPPAGKVLSPTEQAFNSAAKGMWAVDVPEGKMVDSVALYNNESSGTVAYKVDPYQSTKDTLIIKTTVYSNINTPPESYGTKKFYKDAEGVLSSKNYYSNRGIYNDPKQVYNGITKYIPEGDAIVTTDYYGNKSLKYIPQDAKTIIEQSYKEANVKSIITKLFSSVK